MQCTYGSIYICYVSLNFSKRSSKFVIVSMNVCIHSIASSLHLAKGNAVHFYKVYNILSICFREVLIQLLQWEGGWILPTLRLECITERFKTPWSDIFEYFWIHFLLFDVLCCNTVLFCIYFNLLDISLCCCLARSPVKKRDF